MIGMLGTSDLSVESFVERPKKPVFACDFMIGFMFSQPSIIDSCSRRVSSSNLYLGYRLSCQNRFDTVVCRPVVHADIELVHSICSVFVGLSEANDLIAV